jgi:hypothetical protein
MPFQESGDLQPAQVVGLSEIQNLFFDLLRDLKRGILGARVAVDKPWGIKIF